MNNKTTEDILIRSSLLYWLFKRVCLFTLFSVIFFFLKEIYIPYFIEGFSVILFLFIGNSIWSLLRDVLCTSWNITDQMLISKEGVIFKSTNYIELYRIYDYEHKNNLLQDLFGVYDLILHSTDKTDANLRLISISKKNLTTIIRERVELQKSIKGIYEISNR